MTAAGQIRVTYGEMLALTNMIRDFTQLYFVLESSLTLTIFVIK